MNLHSPFILLNFLNSKFILFYQGCLKQWSLWNNSHQWAIWAYTFEQVGLNFFFLRLFIHLRCGCFSYCGSYFVYMFTIDAY